MSVLSKLKRANLMEVGLETGLEFGAGYALGQTYVRYHDKWYGKQAPRVAAIVGKLGSVAARLYAPGAHDLLGGALDAVGSAGVAVMGMEMGLVHARKAKGVKAQLVPAGAALPAGGREITTIGALGRAPSGRALSLDEIEELASYR